MIEKTVVLLKPDAVQRGLIGRIIMRFEDAGMKYIGIKMIWIDRQFARKHYSEHVDKSFYHGLEDMITEGPLIAIALEGICAIAVVRKIVGDTEPMNASPGTIRGDFAHHSYQYADSSRKSIKNLIHASSDRKAAAKELGLWFEKKELYSYGICCEQHVY